MSAKLKTMAALLPLSLILDQWSKQWVVDHLQRGDEPVVWIPGLLNIIRVHNPGIVFGLKLSDSTWVYFAISLVAFGLIGYLYRELKPGQRLLSAAFALALSGAIGNLIDRFRFGHVIDMIDVHFMDRWHWFTFNVADVAIVVGAGLMILDTLRGGGVQSQEEEAQEGQDRRKADAVNG